MLFKAFSFSIPNETYLFPTLIILYRVNVTHVIQNSFVHSSSFYKFSTSSI